MEFKPDLKWREELRKSKAPFEDFLKEEHASNYHGADDDMPDDFDNWLGNLQADEYINLGNEMADLLNYQEPATK